MVEEMIYLICLKNVQGFSPLDSPCLPVSAPAGASSRDSCLIQELRDLCRFPAAGFPHDYHGLRGASTSKHGTVRGEKRMPLDVSACRYSTVKRMPSQAKADAATCN